MESYLYCRTDVGAFDKRWTCLSVDSSAASVSEEAEETGWCPLLVEGLHPSSLQHRRHCVCRLAVVACCLATVHPQRRPCRLSSGTHRGEMTSEVPYSERASRRGP